jgi:hypothetical protein
MVASDVAGTVIKPTRFRLVTLNQVSRPGRGLPSKVRADGTSWCHRPFQRTGARHQCLRRVIACTRHPMRKLVGQFSNLFFTFRPCFKAGWTS